MSPWSLLSWSISSCRCVSVVVPSMKTNLTTIITITIIIIITVM